MELHAVMPQDMTFDNLLSVGAADSLDGMMLSNSNFFEAEYQAMHDRTFPSTEIGDL